MTSKLTAESEDFEVNVSAALLPGNYEVPKGTV